jgi:Spy/CpxP family protein refolding chaperone
MMKSYRQWGRHSGVILAGLSSLILQLAPVPALAQTTPAPVDPAQIFAVLEDLNLSPEQKTQLQQLAQSTRSQIEAILTPEQLDLLRSKMAEGQRLREVLPQLELTLEQRRQVLPITQSARAQVNSILTPEQQEQIQQSLPAPPL